jgi:hypothetical protein
VRPSGSLRHLQGSFVGIIAGSGPERSTYPTVRICAATSDFMKECQIRYAVTDSMCSFKRGEFRFRSVER